MSDGTTNPTSPLSAAQLAVESAQSAAWSANSASEAAASATQALTYQEQAAGCVSAAQEAQIAAQLSATAAASAQSSTTTSSTAVAAAVTQVNAVQTVLQAQLASFGAMWLGDQASDPTTDLTGHPLVSGAMYQNTTDNPPMIRIYTNGAWQNWDQNGLTASANAQLAATQAAGSAAAASVSLTQSQTSQTAASASATASQSSATAAATSATTAASAQTAAQTAQTAAAGSATAAATSVTSASAAATAAQSSDTDAQNQAAAALLSANAAAASAATAATSSTTSSAQAANAAVSAATAASQASTVSAAVVAKGVYSTTAAGLAGTTTGQSFYVSPSSVPNAVADLYSNTAGAAVYYGSLAAPLSSGSVTPDKLSWFTLGVNLFNINTINAGQSLNAANGNLLTTTSWNASNYIPVVGNTEYTLSGSSQVCYYNSQLQWISTLSPNAAQFTTPANAAFVRFASASGAISTFMMVQGVTLPGTFVPYSYSNASSSAYPMTLLADGFSTAGQAALLAALNAETTLSLQPGVIAARNISTFTQSANLFNLNTVNAGNSLNTANGNLLTTSGWNASDYIPVSSNAQYTASNGGHACFYTSSKAFISYVAVSTGVAFTTPANTAFMRLDTAIAISTYQVAAGTAVPSPYVAFGFTLASTNQQPLTVVADAFSSKGQAAIVPALQQVPKVVLQPKALDPVGAGWMNQNPNLFNYNFATTGVALNTASGGTYAASGWQASAFLPINGAFGTTITPGGGTHINWYDVNQNFLSSTGPTLVSTTQTAPTTAAYFRCDTATSTFAIQYGAVAPVAYSAAGYSFDPHYGIQAGNYPWNGKKMVILGDSITNFNDYQPLMAAQTGVVITLSDGVPGRQMRNMVQNINTTNMAGVNLVLVAAGTNDYGGSRPLGTIADNSTVQSFYGDIQYVINTIYTTAQAANGGVQSDCRVIFWTPPPIPGPQGAQTGPSGWTFFPPALNNVSAPITAYQAAIQQVCASLAIPVVDLQSTLGINTYNGVVKTIDGVHPSPTDGMVDLARILAGFINSKV